MKRRVSFILAATDIGPMILNRLDFDPRGDYSPGIILLEDSEYEQGEVDVGGGILAALRHTRGDGVVLMDGGANIGCMTVCWAAGMRGWGSVIAIEPQRHVYYALCGNIALNNIFNAGALQVALSDRVGVLKQPLFDYSQPFPSGSISLRDPLPASVVDLVANAIGEEPVRSITIDSMELPRLDFVKLDIEGMEPQALLGARETLARCKPIVLAEHLVCGQQALRDALADGYDFVSAGINTICVPKGDAILERIKFVELEEEPA